MEKMIKKEKLIHDLKYSSKYNYPCPAWVYQLIEAQEDAVIRCKKCSHCNNSQVFPDKLFCGFIEAYVEPDGFCCFGEGDKKYGGDYEKNYQQKYQ